MAETLSRKERDKRQALAWSLENFVAQGILNIPTILRHIKMSRAIGLAYIASLHGFNLIVGALLEVWPGEKKDTLALMHQAKLGGIENGDKLIIEQILERVSDDDLAKLFDRWMATGPDAPVRLTFEQISNAFAPAELSACVRQAMKMVDILEDAPETTVVEAEDIEEEVEVVPTAPPADANAPQAHWEVIDDAPLAAGQLTGPITSGK